MNGLRDILRIFLRLLQSFYHLPFRFEPVFGKTADLITIIRPFKQQKYFIDYQVEFENVQTTWLLVIVDDSSCLNTPDS